MFFDGGGYAAGGGAIDGAFRKYIRPPRFLQYRILPARLGQGLSYGLNVFNTAGQGFALSRVTGTSSTWVVGVDFMAGTPGPITTERTFLRLDGSAANNDTNLTCDTCALTVSVDSAGILKFYQWAASGMDGTNSGRGTPIIITPAPRPLVMDASTWTYIEFKIVFGAHGSLELRYDDVQVAVVGNSNLPAPPAAVPDRITLYSQGNSIVTANLYVRNDDFLGPVRATTHLVSSDQNCNWLRNTGATDHGAVNETTADGDATVIEGDSNKLELFGLDAVPCFGRILGVSLCAIGRRKSIGVNSPTAFLVKPVPHISSVITLQAATDWADDYTAIQTPPSEFSLLTGARWTAGEVQNAWWGMSAPGPGTARVTQAWVEVLTSLRNVPFNCGQLGSYTF